MTTHSSDQSFDIPLESIVPEYGSQNPLVRWLFFQRLKTAASFVRNVCSDARFVLDLGCGECLLAKEVVSQVPSAKVLEVDLNEFLSRKGVQSYEFRSRQDIERLAIRAGAVDCICTLDVLEHFPSLTGVLNECQRVLRPGGFLVVSAPTESGVYQFLRWVLKGTASSQEGPGAGAHHQTARTVHEAIAAHGFKSLELKRLPGFLMPTLFEIRLYQRPA